MSPQALRALIVVWFCSLAAATAQASGQGQPEPAQESASARLTIHTLTSRRLDADAVPQVAFEVYAPASLPSDPRGLEMGRVVYDVRATDKPIATGRTGDDGIAEFVLPAEGLPLSEDGVPAVLVRVSEPGYQGRWASNLYMVRDPSRRLEVRLPAVPGATATGFTVDAAGISTVATGRLHRWVGGEDLRELDSGTSVRGFVDGRFEVDYDKDLQGGVLKFDGGEAGRAIQEDLNWSLAEPPDFVLILIEGPGKLTGRILDEANRPCAGLSFSAQHESWFHGKPDPRGGHLRREFTTDEHGCFSLTGLLAGAYFVRTRSARRGFFGEFDVTLTRQPVPANGEPLELRYTTPHLLVKPTGLTPQAEQLPLSIRQRDTRFSMEGGWPLGLELMVYRALGSGQAAVLAGGEPLEGKLLPSGHAVFPLPEPGTYLVGVRGIDWAAAFQVVEVSERSGVVPVEMELPPPTSRGRVQVYVTHGGENLSGEDYSKPFFTVFLEDLQTGVRLLERPRYARSSSHFRPQTPFGLEAPAGRYRLVAEGAPVIESHHGTLMKERSLGRIEKEVELLADSTSEFTLEIPEGARIELTLQGSPNALDFEAADIELEGYHPDYRAAQRDKYARRSRVELHRAGSPPVSVPYSETHAMSYGDHWSDAGSWAGRPPRTGCRAVATPWSPGCPADVRFARTWTAGRAKRS